MIRTMLTFVKQRGFDLNALNIAGRTPLLEHMQARGATSLVIAETLLEMGADPHAVDRHGDNAIQLALFSNTAWREECAPEFLRTSSEFPAVLLAKLNLLIRAGVERYHKNSQGEDALSYAISCDCLETWNTALEMNEGLGPHHEDLG